MELWLAGASAYIALVTIQTIRAARRWSQARLSTDHALLELLEDCKAEASVTAPIGLVVSDAVSSPAILGWLHPRILLPAPLVTSLPTAKLRPIILHELAHFRWLDVPFNWLLTLVRAVHWFNPLAHLGAIAWTRFREEAADEAAVRWLGDKSGQVYGDALIQLFRDPQAAGAPSGALAIAESVTQLRRRLSLIHRFPSKAPRLLLTSAISLLLGLAVFAKTTEDRTEQDARADAKAWLQKIDDGEYANAWEDLSPQWRADAPLNQWTEKLNKVRTPLGKCRQRVEISLQKEEDLRFLQSVLKGKFIAVEFRTSFENADHLGESLLISKEPDGVWRVFGYTIHP